MSPLVTHRIAYMYTYIHTYRISTQIFGMLILLCHLRHHKKINIGIHLKHLQFNMLLLDMQQPNKPWMIITIGWSSNLESGSENIRVAVFLSRAGEHSKRADCSPPLVFIPLPGPLGVRNVKESLCSYR